jgi:uncharacterized protein with LGFP repeats
VDVGGYDSAGGYDAAVDGRWRHGDAEAATEHFPLGDLHTPEHQPPPDDGSTQEVSWPPAWTAAGLAEGDYGDEMPSGAEEDSDQLGIDEEDPDAVDTDSIPLVSDDALLEDGYPEVVPEHGYPDADYPETVAVSEDDYLEAAYPETIHPESIHPEAAVPEAAHQDAEAAHPDETYPDTDAAFPDVAVPRTPPDAGHPEAAYPAAGPEAGEAAYPDVAVPHTAPDVAVAGAGASGPAPTAGRHAAVDTEDESELAEQIANAELGPAGRPTIHLPLDDPYQVPDGYPIKASARFGLYYTPDSALYHDTLAEIWLSSEAVAQANGFIKAD